MFKQRKVLQEGNRWLSEPVTDGGDKPIGIRSLDLLGGRNLTISC